MLKENFNKKGVMNEVFSIKGEDLKIEDTILGGLKDDCLGLIVRDIHIHMRKKKFDEYGRVNVFEPFTIDDEEMINDLDEGDIGIFHIMYSSDDKTWRGCTKNSNLDITNLDEYTNHLPPESFKYKHEFMIDLIKKSLQPYSKQYNTKIRFKNVKGFVYTYEVFDLRNPSVQDYFLETFNTNFVQWGKNNEIRMYKHSE